MNKYPFKFLDSYNASDKDIFFGRDDEIKALYEMVFQNSMVLVYGASGTGKTSLIQCGLSGKFKSYDWMPLLVRRGNNINEALKKTLEDNGGNYAGDDEQKTTTQKSVFAKLIEGVYLSNFKPIYLIFDQFEELYIIGKKDEQELFTTIIKEIILCEQPVKMIFSIRDEYLGHLYEFEKAVPQLMRKKLRVEPMYFEKVKQVIIGASSYKNSNVKLTVGEEEQIARGVFDKIKGNLLTIQLPFLQVFLDKFYLKITGDESRTAEAVFTMQALNEMGEIGDVLINFLDEQVTSISKNLKAKFPDLTPEMIWRVLSPFSTVDGTKEPISKQGLCERLTGVDPKLIDEIITAFTNSRILRYNEATDMYEIAHDALAKPISEKRSVEEKTLLEVKRLIKSQVAVKAEAREYFTERQLVFIESYLDKIKISDEEKDWINKSRTYNLEQKDEQLKKQHDDLAKRKKQRLLTIGIVVLLFVIAGTLTVNKKLSDQKNEISAQKEEVSKALNLAKQALTLERENKLLIAKAANDSLEIQNKSFASYGISQNKINTLSESELDIISDLNQQIALLTSESEVDKSFTIQYFPKLDDEDKAFLILKELGYKLEIKKVEENMAGVATNCIWIGSNVNAKVDNVKLVAFCLMRAGIKLKAIKLFENPNGDKANLIQVGARKESIGKAELTIEQINDAKKYDSEGIAK